MELIFFFLSSFFMSIPNSASLWLEVIFNLLCILDNIIIYICLTCSWIFLVDFAGNCVRGGWDGVNSSQISFCCCQGTIPPIYCILMKYFTLRMIIVLLSLYIFISVLEWLLFYYHYIHLLRYFHTYLCKYRIVTFGQKYSSTKYCSKY